MTHPCACCQLRFVHAAELADHVRNEHADRTEVPERHETITTSRVRPVPADHHDRVVRLPW